jgi:hypothetical protein
MLQVFFADTPYARATQAQTFHFAAAQQGVDRGLVDVQNLCDLINSQEPWERV